MKRYFVIKHTSSDNGHLNVQDLLPASCKLITGIGINVTVKQESEKVDEKAMLSFPQSLIKNILKQENITGLFYSYLRTRATEAESRDFFESDILPVIVRTLSSSISFSCLSRDEQELMNTNLQELFNTQFTDYLYNENGLFEKGKIMTSRSFADLIAQQALVFVYMNQSDVFFRTQKVYRQPEPYECGNISLLVNGNNFLLRDYVLIANRKVKNIEKEIIPFHEPLEVNSNIHTVFKSNKNSEGRTLAIRTYIEYEYQ